MIKIAPEQGRAGVVKPATANINLALAILAINTPAPAQVTPAVQVLLVEVSTPPAPVLQIILGMEAIAFFLVHQAINTLVQALVTLAA